MVCPRCLIIVVIVALFIGAGLVYHVAPLFLCFSPPLFSAFHEIQKNSAAAAVDDGRGQLYGDGCVAKRCLVFGVGAVVVGGVKT